MDLLTAVNQILPKLGERPVTSTDSKSPTLAVILPQLDADRMMLLQTGWWFNLFEGVKLYPDSEGGVAIPDDTLSFIADRNQEPVVVRGTKLMRTRDMSFVFPVGTPITGTLIQDVAFAELPESAARYVLYTALITCYATDIGLEQVVQMWQQYAKAALGSMEQEHMRQRHYTIKATRQYMNLRRGMRG